MVQESEQSLFGLVNVSQITTHTVRVHKAFPPQIMMLFRLAWRLRVFTAVQARLGGIVSVCPVRSNTLRIASRCATALEALARVPLGKRLAVRGPWRNLDEAALWGQELLNRLSSRRHNVSSDPHKRYFSLSHILNVFAYSHRSRFPVTPSCFE